MEETATESFPLMILAAFYINAYPTLSCTYVKCARIPDLRRCCPSGILPASDNLDPPFLDVYIEAIQNADVRCSAWPQSEAGWFGAPTKLVEMLPTPKGTSLLLQSIRAMVLGESFTSEDLNSLLQLIIFSAMKPLVIGHSNSVNVFSEVTARDPSMPHC